jgi:hypothetical protein
LACLGKPEYPVWVGSFIIESKKEAKQGNLKIKVYLRHGKGRQGIKGQRQNKFKPKDDVTKPYHPVWDSGLSGFSRTNTIRLARV